MQLKEYLDSEVISFEEFSQKGRVCNFLSLFVKYCTIDATRAERSLKMNVKVLRNQEAVEDAFSTLLNLNLSKIFKPGKYLGMIFEIFKKKLGSEAEKSLTFEEFLKDRNAILQSEHLFKLKILHEMKSVKNIKPYIEDEFR